MERICPICGMPYSTTEKRTYNKTTYIYFIHKTKLENGKTKIHKCYGGAINSYVYVQKFHNNSNLVLIGYPSYEQKTTKYLTYLEQVLSSFQDYQEFQRFSIQVRRILWKYDKRFQKQNNNNITQ
jgi:hypothetical protein